ncbi:nucleolar complex protein 14, variant 2 [Batrachochytrium dendrobatidis]|nr:nucleolar complex protein 14, variant 2 [Batrachochytrium dendrobatidis]
MEVQDSLDADLEEIRGMLAPMQDRPITEGKMVISNERAQLISGEIAIRPSELKSAYKGKVENDVEFNPPSAVKLDDDYDKFVRELAYDRRAKPTDRIKNEDELAQEEKKRLEKLEQERLRRMKGDDSENDTAKTKSGKKRAAQADDLGDDDYTEHVDSTVSREAEMALTYKNGELINEKIFMSKRADSSSESDDEDDLSQDEDDDEDEDEDEDDNQDEDGDQNITKLSKTRVQSNRDASVEPEFEMSDKDDSNSGQYESYSEDESNEDSSNSDQETESISKASDTIATTEDQDNEQVPYVLVAPESIEDLLTLLDGKSATYQQTAIKRLRILNNVRLGSECKQNLSRLSMLLLDYRDHVVSLSPPNIALLKVLEGHTVELGRLFSAQTAEYSLQRITAIQGALVKSMSAGSKKHTGFPNLADLYFFRIVGEVFCTSDMQHTVVTPTILLMSQFLGQCPISTAQDAMSGLFLCEIFSEYFALSKRFVPEVANFLHRLCASCLGVKDAIILSMIPLPSMMNSILSIKDFSAEPATLCVSSMPLFSKAKNLSESVKIALLTEAFHLLSKCSRLWNETGSSIEIFAPTMLLFEKIPKAELAERSQQMIHSAHSNIKSQILSAGLKRRPLQLQKRKAIPIATYVPRFEDGYSHDRRYDPDRDRAERSKMQSELKQERRGAERELRKDAAFVARQQLQEIKEKDAAYKKKMDKIMGQLASQEGAMRGVERANKKPRQRR